MLSIYLVSTASNGTQANSYSYFSSLSANGRYVAFNSDASNLVVGDTNEKGDIFVKDTQTGALVRVSTTSNGTEANGASYAPSLSADGRYVAFYSFASNLVDNDTNDTWDIFVKDLEDGILTRVSTTSNGTQANGASYAPSLSADGRYVAFYSEATNLVDNDTNDREDIFLKDLQTGTLTRVSTASNGTQANDASYAPSLSADGRYVAFYSYASNLVAGDTNNASDIFVKDLSTGSITLVSTASDGTQANSYSYDPSISADGRYVAFYSEATNLVPGGPNTIRDVFVKDLWTGTLTRVSRAAEGTPANGSSYAPTISANGQYVAFYSEASNLVPDDINNTWDVFLKDWRNVAPTSSSDTIINLEEGGVYIFQWNDFPFQDEDLGHSLQAIQITKLPQKGTMFLEAKPIAIAGITVTAAQLKAGLLTYKAPTNENSSSYPTLRFKVSDGLELSAAESTLTLHVTPAPPASLEASRGQLVPYANQLIGITGSGPALINARVTGHRAQTVGEIIVLVVDDGEGRVNGLLPGQVGYQAAALQRAMTLMSVLPKGDFEGLASDRSLAVMPGQFLQLALVQGATLDEMRQGKAGQVVFATGLANGDGLSAVQGSSPSPERMTVGFRFPSSNSFSDITLELTLGKGQAPLGSAHQGMALESEILDLTGMATPTVNVKVEVFREAWLNNTVGFYTIQDRQGRVKDPLTGNLVSPGDDGYVRAALGNQVMGALVGTNGQTSTYHFELSTGQLLSTFLVVHGSVEAVLNSRSDEAPLVFFNHIAANGDKQDHVRLLGNNTFGYEDMPGGGDRDFNDVIVKVSLQPV